MKNYIPTRYSRPKDALWMPNYLLLEFKVSVTGWVAKRTPSSDPEARRILQTHEKEDPQVRGREIVQT